MTTAAPSTVMKPLLRPSSALRPMAGLGRLSVSLAGGNRPRLVGR